MTTVSIHVNLDHNCSSCGKAGATPNGLCLACMTKSIQEGKYDDIIKRKGSRNNESPLYRPR